MWIAFKSLYLCSLKQQAIQTYTTSTCCELLSKICIFVVWNNPHRNIRRPQRVVNCFQKFVSLLSETTDNRFCIFVLSLWIAFKNLYLCCLKQLLPERLSRSPCCELLSKICIFVVWNNIPLWVLSSSSVVNCFQKFVSLLSETTLGVFAIYCVLLWIAFKNLYLCCLKQLIGLALLKIRVVNCFQKFVSLLSETTRANMRAI